MTPKSAERGPFDLPWPGLLGLGVFLLTLWAQTGALVGVFVDDGIYVTLAKALAEGQGYRNINLPDAPPNVRFPFLYPLALSLLWRAWPQFPANVVLFQLFDAAVLGAAAWLMARHAGRIGLPGRLRYGGLALGFLAYPLLTLSGVRFSEPLFLLLVSAAVLVADRERVDLRSAGLAGALTGLAVLTRSVGVIALIGVPAAYWLRRERRAALLALAVGVVVSLPWLVWVATQSGAVDPRLAAGYGPYAHVAPGMGLGQVVADPMGAFGPVARLLLSRVPRVLWYPLAFALAALLVYGAARVAHRAPALVACLGLYLALVTVWPYLPDRFVWIVLPWLFLLMLDGARGVWRRGWHGRVFVGALAIAVGWGFLRVQVLSLSQRRFANTAEGIAAPFRVLVRSIRAETPADAVIAAELEPMVYLYTGRRTVPAVPFRLGRPGAVDDELLPLDSVVALFCEARVTHVAFPDPLTADHGPAYELAQRYDSTMTPLFVTGGPALYRFRCPG